MTGPKVWRDYDQAALDAQYDQRVLVPHADDYMARHLEMGKRVRAELDCRLDVAYGPHADEVLDIFPSPASKTEPGAPVVVYVHGGAWTRWHKDHNSYQARSFVGAGAAFVSVNFSLVPTVTLDEQVGQVRAAVAWTHANADSFGADPDRLFVAGHSSGAHIVGLLCVTDWAADWGLPADLIKGAAAASGMYDLEPVRLSARNKYLNLDTAAVERLSALRQLPDRMPPMILATGGGELDEFQRHTRDFAAELTRRGHACAVIDFPSHNHFHVAEEFDNPDGPLLTAFFGMMGLAPGDEE